MPRPKKSDLAKAKKKAFDCLRLSVETNNPHEAKTARKMAEGIAKKYGFCLYQLAEEERRAALGVKPRPPHPIPRQKAARKTPQPLKWKESELLRSAFIFITGENPTPREFEKSLGRVAAKIADFLETVRER